MGQRGRKSGAALAVVGGTDIDGRPHAPSDLTDFQREVWERTVANEAADTFRTAALQQLLKEYCRHVASADRLARMIQATEALDVLSADDLEDLERMLRMRDKETKALADKATKLRLTNQSRYTPQAAATASKRGATERKPWQSVG
jgi:hypothetical protein